MATDSPAEILRLRAAFRDLVALSTMPAVWVGREPPAIAAGFADVLVGSLLLDFAFVRLCDPNGGAAVEVTRGDAWQAFPEWLERHLAIAGPFSRKAIIPDVGDGAGPCRGIVMPIGVSAEGGLVAAACDRTDFPTEIDQLLLSVAANHASTAFQNSRLIHERRRAEQALRKSEHELRQARDGLEMKVAERTAELRRSEAYLVEAQRLSHTGSWAWSPATGEFTYWSEECFRLLGFEPAERIPEFAQTFQRIHPDDQSRVADLYQRNVRATADHEMEFRILHPRHGVRDIHIFGHPILGPSGDLVEFRGTVIDITERKRADEALRDLAYMSRLITMGELTASLAHELNQPIAAAATNARTTQRWLTREQPDLEEAREAASRIIHDVTRAADIISHIRSLFKKSAPQREWVDINGVIREMIVLLRSEAARCSIPIRAQLAGDLPSVLADRVQLQQVFMNLMLNGIDAMKDLSPAGALTIRSRAENGQLLISVSDTGVGLPPQADKIFSAFFTTKPGGIGMGLAISRSIIESHGGRLWAVANSGRGATFHFTLPAKAVVS